MGLPSHQPSDTDNGVRERAQPTSLRVDAKMNEPSSSDASTLDATLWPSGGDFGDEGAVAQMIASYPAPIQSSTALLAPQPQMAANPAYVAVHSILSRWNERVNRKSRIADSFDEAKFGPSVVVVRACDPGDVALRKLLNCGTCSDGELRAKAAALREDATARPVLLIPTDRLLEGVVLMARTFRFHPADLLFLRGGSEAKETCPEGDGLLHQIAVASLQKRMEDDGSFGAKLNVFKRLLMALPNYCQGMYQFSQCSLMSGKPWSLKSSRRREEFTCPKPEAVAPEETPAGLTGDKQKAARMLLDTAWPHCTTTAGGCGVSHGIAFVKTHKTASSTMEGMLHRLCLTRRLKCLTHSGKFLNVEYPEMTEQVEFPHVRAPALRPPYDAVVAHTMNVPVLRNSIVPTSRGHVLTIVREAASRYKSHWNFWVRGDDLVAPGLYPWKASQLTEGFCKETLNDPDVRASLETAPLNIRPALNNMARQLMGCTHCGTGAALRTRFNALIEEIRRPDSTYHILITEKLHESLLLMKRDYGLQTADLLYISRNVGSYKKSENTGLKTCLRELNSLDNELFVAASEVHDRRVQELGDDFAAEVREFDALVAATRTCAKDWNCEKGSASALCVQCHSMSSSYDATEHLIGHFRKCTPAPKHK
ncbi:hypothetical protein DIPPA_06870 [Diplonema papillatum]|nr:hypothetical protein DIPPA_06870 [Diplonema papillatum]